MNPGTLGLRVVSDCARGVLVGWGRAVLPCHVLFPLKTPAFGVWRSEFSGGLLVFRLGVTIWKDSHP